MELSADIYPAEIDVLKTNICPRSGKYASFKNIKFPRGNYQPKVPRQKNINTLLSLLFTTIFFSARQFKNHIELFSAFLNVRFEKENR